MFYDNMGRNNGITYHDNTTVTKSYSLQGIEVLTYGSRTYPAGYSYDYAGRLKRMTNWTTFDTVTQTGTGARVTTWNYDSVRGWLNSKRDPNSKGVDYTYTSGGRVKTRQWARIGTGSNRVKATYNYGFDDATSSNEHRDVTKITYNSDPTATPTLTYDYDRWGLLKKTVQGTTTNTITYNDAGQQLTESYSGGTLGGFSVTVGYNTKLQRDSLTAAGVTGYNVGYTYDLAGRLGTLNDTTSTFTYGYVPNSMLVQSVTTSGTSGNMTTTRTYDVLNRLQSISSVASGVTMPVSYTYTYNSANQRDRVTVADGSYWSYGYDSLGQVTNGKHYWKDTTLVAGQQYEYVFDTIGNRTSTKVGGDASGGNLRSIGYAVNNLNQYTSRTNSSSVDVLGLGVPSQTVTVNGTTAYRKGEYFHHAKAVNNASAPVYTNLTVTSGAESSSGYVFVPKQVEAFGHDADGNLTNDGRWSFTWDAENRLVKMEPSGTITPPANSRRKLEFAYDYMGRRIWKKVTNLDTSAVTQERYLYDDWNLIAVLDGSTATLLKSFVWGTDLSGTLQGAGGVGGLLKVRQHSPTVANAYVAYDGNGNVTALVNTSDGKFSARYEYGPFGEVIRATGPASGSLAKVNPFRFSTKYQDDETDLLYYGYRYYNAGTGRWLTRDPIEEQHGQGSYAFVANSGISDFDVLGLLHSGQIIQIGDECTLRVSGYSPQPLFAYGQRNMNTKVGAYLRIEVSCNCDGCACYKWRQHYTKFEDGKRIRNNVLDAAKGEKWYSAKSDEPLGGCTYTFQDQPEQSPPPGMFMSSLDQVQRVVVSFNLELVKLSNCSASSGTTVATIRWGFWYTKDANGLLNWDRHE